jgi:predicted nucleic acid-binding protein
MTSKVFIDTNILVYALDQHDPDKHKKSRSCLRQLARTSGGVISTQVMQEFYVTATKKLQVDALLVKEILHSFAQFEIVLISPEIIDRAVDCQILNQISFWDALIVSAAQSACCEVLWTEDLNPGQIIQEVRIENPMIL